MGLLDVVLFSLSEQFGVKKKKVWGKLCVFPPGEKKEKKIQHLQVPSNPALVYGEVKGCEKTNLRERDRVCVSRCQWVWGASHFKECHLNTN